jgi:hypothetical protein
MPDQVIDIPGIGPTSFPDSMTDAQVNAAATRLYQNANVGKKQPPVTSWTDAAVKALPAVGAAAGGIIGGIGGTVAGMGVGGVPGAAGGAGVGGAAGEAAKQLINRARGAQAPQTASDAALAIGKEGAIDAASTGAMGALGSKLVPAATTGLMDFGTSPTAKQTGATIGKVIGGVAAPAIGAYEAGAPGLIAGLVGAAQGAWTGGKTGWFTAKLAQDAARPIANILSKATGATTAAIAESLSGLTLGHAVAALIGAGVPTGEAVRTVANAQVKAGQN